MTRTRALTAAAVLLLALTGCSGGDKTAPAAAPTTPASSSHTKAERSYLDALRKIDPALVAKEDRAIRRGKDTCDTIAGGDDHAAVVTMTAARFSGSGTEISNAQAEQIVKAAQTSLCPR